MPPLARPPAQACPRGPDWQPRPRVARAGLAAITKGRGPLVVLLHGVGLRAEAWAPMIYALSRAYSVLAPDMPGHGESPFPGALPQGAVPPCLRDYADAVLPLIDRPALVIGHSMGALMALDLAARHPGKLRGVVALNAIFERNAGATAAVQARAARLDGVTAPNPSATLTRWFGEARHAEREACRAWLQAVPPAGYKAAYTAFAHDPGPSRNAMAALAMPALFMTGAAEPNSTPAMSEAMAALAPQGRCRIVQGAAHMMPMTHAAEVGAALLAFARDVDT